LAFRNARAFSQAHNGVPRPRAALMLTTADPGNLGDEAVFWALARVLKTEQFERVCVISFTPEKLWKVPETDTVAIPVHHNPRGADYLGFVRLLREFSHFYVWGADIVDGSHGPYVAQTRLTLANLAAAAGVKTTVCSFSICESPLPKIMHRFRHLDPRVALYCRDDVSLKRLSDRIGPRAKLCADLAFLLEPDSRSALVREARTFVESARSTGRTVIGINLNDMFCGYFGSFEPPTLAKQYVDILLKLRSYLPQFVVIHLPHNTYPGRLKPAVSDFDLARLFQSAWPAELRQDTFLPPDQMRAVEVRALSGLVDCVFSGRMHLSIASLSQGTPAFGVTYQGKFEGLFRHFGLEDMYITPEQLMDTDATANVLAENIKRVPELRGKIKKRLPQVIELARLNLNLA
jgi:polysaccharide pyruvyl transferase WcaK-like protein